jgi:hypothetical protein
MKKKSPKRQSVVAHSRAKAKSIEDYSDVLPQEVIDTIRKTLRYKPKSVKRKKPK